MPEPTSIRDVIEQATWDADLTERDASEITSAVLAWHEQQIAAERDSIIEAVRGIYPDRMAWEAYRRKIAALVLADARARIEALYEDDDELVGKPEVLAALAAPAPSREEAAYEDIGYAIATARLREVEAMAAFVRGIQRAVQAAPAPSRPHPYEQAIEQAERAIEQAERAIEQAERAPSRPDVQTVLTSDQAKTAYVANIESAYVNAVNEHDDGAVWLDAAERIAKTVTILMAERRQP